MAYGKETWFKKYYSFIFSQGIYTCTAGPLRRSWRVLALQPAHWVGSARNVNGTEGNGARVSCGTPAGQPRPKVFWLMNGHPVEGDPVIKTTGKC